MLKMIRLFFLWFLEAFRWRILLDCKCFVLCAFITICDCVKLPPIIIFMIFSCYPLGMLAMYVNNSREWSVRKDDWSICFLPYQMILVTVLQAIIVVLFYIHKVWKILIKHGLNNLCISHFVVKTDHTTYVYMYLV